MYKNPDNLIFFKKISYIGSSDVTIDSMYLRLNLSTTPDLKF
jgi:hypothetical protein